MAYPRFRRARAHKFITSLAGDFSITSTSFVAVTATALDLVLGAQPGDTIEYGLSGLWGNQAIVGEADILLVTSGRLTSGATRGYGGWSGQSGAYGAVGGSVQFVVGSGDIASGLVTLRLAARVFSAGTKTMFASNTGYPLHLWAKNIGPVDPT